MPSFKSNSGGHVRIIRPDGPIIDIDEGGSYETSDEGEIEALRDSPEVSGADDEQESDGDGQRATRDENPEPVEAVRGPQSKGPKKAR